jgi:tripartite-type tricarboxylate transporter receptor subunit TctC
MLTDLMGGSVQVALSNTPVVGPHVQSGRMRGIGISDNKRSPTFPSIPTVAEQAINTLSKRMMYYPIIQVNSSIYALFQICYTFHHSH